MDQFLTDTQDVGSREALPGSFLRGKWRVLLLAKVCHGDGRHPNAITCVIPDQATTLPRAVENSVVCL